MGFFAEDRLAGAFFFGSASGDSAGSTAFFAAGFLFALGAGASSAGMTGGPAGALARRLARGAAGCGAWKMLVVAADAGAVMSSLKAIPRVGVATPHPAYCRSKPARWRA